VAATYSIAVNYGGSAIQNSPFSVVIQPGPPSSLTQVSGGGGLPSGTHNVVSTFVLVAYDSFDNLDTVGGHHFVVKLSNNNHVIFRGWLTDTNNGDYTVSYNVTSAGNYSVYVSVAHDALNGTGLGLTGNYYNNRWLQGSAVLSRVDQLINFNWGTDLITPTANNYVSVSWTGFVKADFAQNYTFTVNVDDGCRLYVNNILIIDQWNGNGYGVYIGYYAFPIANILYDIRLDYRQKYQ